MCKLTGGSLVILALAGSALAAAPAEARYWGGWHGHRGWHDGGDAVVAGIAGLAIGAAIADSAHPHYYARPRYYAPPRYYGYYGPTCWTQWRWDPWYGNVPVRVCD